MATMFEVLGSANEVVSLPTLFAVQGSQTPPSTIDRFWSVFCLSIFFLLTSLNQLDFLHSTRRSPNQPKYSHPVTMALVVSAPFALVFLAAVGPKHALFALAVAIGLGTSLLNPTCGVSFFVSAFIVRPWEHLPANFLVLLMPRMIAIVVFTSWLFHNWRAQRQQLFWSVPCTVLLLFALWMFVTIVTSGFQYETPKGYFETFYPLLFTSFMIYNVLIDREGIDLVSSSLVTSSAAILAGALVYHVLLHGFNFGIRLEFIGIWGNSNELGALSALALPFAFFLHVLRARSLPHLVIGFLELSVLLFGMWATQSRGAYLSLAVAGAAYLFFCSRSLKRKFLLGSISVALTVVFLATIQRSESDLEGSQSSRFNFLIAGLRMVKDNPVFGIGMGGFGPNYEAYTPSFVEWGSRTAHSSWLLAFAEGAFPALFLYALLYLYGFAGSWKVRDVRPEIFLGLVGYGVSMTFLSHTYLLLPYLIVFLSLTAHRAFGSAKLRMGRTATTTPSKKDGQRAETFTPVVPF